MERGELAVGTATPRRHPDARSDRSVIAEQTSCRRVRVRILYQPFSHTGNQPFSHFTLASRCFSTLFPLFPLSRHIYIYYISVKILRCVRCILSSDSNVHTPPFPALVEFPTHTGSSYTSRHPLIPPLPNRTDFVRILQPLREEFPRVQNCTRRKEEERGLKYLSSPDSRSFSRCPLPLLSLGCFLETRIYLAVGRRHPSLFLPFSSPRDAPRNIVTRGRSVTAPLRPPHVRPFHSPEFHEFPFDLVIALSFHSFHPILRYSDPNYGFRAWWINSESRRRGRGGEVENNGDAVVGREGASNFLGERMRDSCRENSLVCVERARRHARGAIIYSEFATASKHSHVAVVNEPTTRSFLSMLRPIPSKWNTDW